MSILNRVLPPSRTHKSRGYDLIPGAHPLVDYSLVIRQGEKHRKNYEESLYFVQEFPCPVPGWSYAFLVLKDDDADPEVYECVTGTPAEVGYCTCRAARCGMFCKHLEALRDACFEVGLPDPVGGVRREEVATV